VADVDGTGGYTLGMRVDQQNRDFIFEVGRKQ
jgi:hypothetical protein